MKRCSLVEPGAPAPRPRDGGAVDAVRRRPPRPDPRVHHADRRPAAPPSVHRVVTTPLSSWTSSPRSSVRLQGEHAQRVRGRPQTQTNGRVAYCYLHHPTTVAFRLQ